MFRKTMLCRILLAVQCCIIAVYCQSTTRPLPPSPTTPVWTAPDEWDFYIHLYPNPQTDIAKCNQTEPSWLCDPNKLLLKTQHDVINSMLHNVTHVDGCSRESCLPFSVALIKKLKFLNVDEVQVKLQENSDKLLQSWLAAGGYSSGALLVISTGDNEAYISVHNVRELSECVQKLALHPEDDMSDNMRLNEYIIDTMKQYRVQCAPAPPPVAAHTVHPAVIVLIVVISLVIIVIIIVSIVVWHRRRKAQPKQSRQDETAAAEHLASHHQNA